MGRKLSKKQKRFLKEVFENGLTESRAIRKVRIHDSTYRVWQQDRHFMDEYKYCMRNALAEGKTLIARHCGYAAAKLVSLTDCEKEETARKACLDVMETAWKTLEKQSQTAPENAQSEPKGEPMTPEQASKIMDILANDNTEK